MVEPWQMTQKEWLVDVGYKSSQGSRVRENWLGTHKGEVRIAIQNRKPVPAEVLADYPDLKPIVSPYKKPPLPHEVPVFGEVGAVPEYKPEAAGRRKVIEARLKRGESVGDKLLAEFPDLAEKYGIKLPVPPTEVAALEPIRDKWLQTANGNRYTELKGMYGVRSPKETTEYRKLEQEFLELGMTPKEKVAWRTEGEELKRIDEAEFLQKLDEFGEPIVKAISKASGNPGFTPEVTRNLPEIIARLDYSKTVPPEIQSRVEKLLFSLPPELEPNIKRIIVTDKMIGKFGEPGKGYSAQWVDSERIMRLNHRFTDGDFYHEVAHALNPDKSEKEVEQLGRLLEERMKTLPKASGNPGFTAKEAKSIGEKLGIDFKRYDVDQFRQGLNVELEHCNVTDCDPILTGKIAQAHLNELPDYYTRLAKMEKGSRMKPEEELDLARTLTKTPKGELAALYKKITGREPEPGRIPEVKGVNDLLPMPPDEGPPLPRALGIKWPGKK